MQQNYTSYAKQALQQIAFEMGKPISLVEPYIKILEENWYDTKDAIKSMKIETFEEFKIPKRIAQLLIDHASKSEDKATNWQLELAKIISEISDQDQLLKTLEVLFKIITNVMQNTLSPQYQRMNISSKTLQNNILKYPAALNYLTLLGWKIEAEFLTTSYKIEQAEQWQEAAQQLLNFTQKQEGFHPQKPAFHSSTGMTNIVSEVARKEGYDIYSFTQKLEELQQKRYEIMSQPIQDREIKVYIGSQFNQGKQLQQKIQEQDDFEEVQPHQDPQLMKFLQQIAQSLEEQQFASKRKKEYEELMKKPIFSRTEIRVQFPNDMIVQAVFSPLETLQKLVDLITTMLAKKDQQFYLYTTPPVVKMTQKYLNQTFDDLSSVPNGLFYFGVDQPQPGQNYLGEGWIDSAKRL